MNAEIFAALAQLEKERGIPQDYMLEKITQALIAAYKKDKEGYTDNVFVEIKDNDMHMYVQKEVVDDVLTPATEISLDEARKINKHAELGDLVNVERSMKPDALLDGHIVQGHVDQTAVCTAVEDAEGSWYFTFRYEPQGDNCTVEKGSVSVNGVSLTVCDSRDDGFRVAIIPYTYEHTNFCRIGVGSVVNLEFDIVGKYIARLMRNYMKR